MEDVALRTLLYVEETETNQSLGDMVGKKALWCPECG